MMMMAELRSDTAAVVEIEVDDQIRLAPRVRRFFQAYLDADALRRGNIRKAVAFASHRFRFDPPATPSFEEDVGAALAIARAAAAMAVLTDRGEMIDAARSGLIDCGLLPDAYAALALGYRYVVGLYALDLALCDLGEAAVRLILLAEAEYDTLFTVAIPARHAVRRSVLELDQSSSGVSFFLPPAARQNEVVGVSLEAVSQRLKDQILLLA